MSAAHSWIFFDIDATLMDHEEAFRAGTASLHVESGASSALADFTTRWSAAHERNFDRFLASDPKIFRHACERCAIDPGVAVYVGDRYDVDAEGARRAGLTGVWLDRTRTASLRHRAPIIQSLADLPALVAKLSRG
jgi:FMN phosphatase YigB (HAD superfamily)